MSIASPPPLFHTPFDAMASRCEVKLNAPTAAAAQRYADLAIAEVKRIEHAYSRYRPDSVVSRINAAAGGKSAVLCDAETVSLLDYAGSLFAMSDGLFDITSGVLRQAWHFKQAKVPSPSRLKPLLDLVGWARVERDGARIRLPQAGMELDFGGFGKEYAADRAAAVLMDVGVTQGYVNLGGDMRVIGPQPDGSPWAVGIQDPRRAGQVIATIPVSSGALATSGDYERFFEHKGRRYCHILNPHTGYPVAHWQSVSVLAPLSITAGSCTTIAMLKAADGAAFLAQTGLMYLTIDAHGQFGQPPA